MADRSRTLTGSPAVALDEVARRVEGPGARFDGASRQAARSFPVRWTSHYLGLVRGGDPDDPIRRTAYPHADELEPAATDLADPVGERVSNPVPYVVRKHADRAVLLVTARCHVYCRFCFRRAFPDGAHRDPGAATLDAAIDYLVADAELREVILSGGDPLVLPDGELARIVGRLSRSPRLERLRVHTRAPVHDPARVTPALARVLTGGLPMRVVTHVNHPRELTRPTVGAVATLRAEGIPVLNQAVLLRGVNDDVETLEALCTALAGDAIEPYYLHHPDRVPGGGAFYLTPEAGLELFRALRARLGRDNPALPAYVIDLPDGSGKIPVEAYLQSRGCQTPSNL